MPDDTSESPRESLSDRISAHRAKLGWTQQELADRVGISRVAVSHLESGLSDAGERTVALLAGVFKVEPHELVAGTSYPTAKAERLPVVVARHTEVEQQLALLDADLAWLDHVPAAVGRQRLQSWAARLVALESDTFDRRQRALVAEGARRVGRWLDGLSPEG